MGRATVVTEQPHRVDTAAAVDAAIRARLRAQGQLADDEIPTAEIIGVKVRKMGSDGPVGPGRRLLMIPLPVDSDEAVGMLDHMLRQLRSGGFPDVA
jgi:hypothetical protein